MTPSLCGEGTGGGRSEGRGHVASESSRKKGRSVDQEKRGTAGCRSQRGLARGLETQRRKREQPRGHPDLGREQCCVCWGKQCLSGAMEKSVLSDTLVDTLGFEFWGAHRAGDAALALSAGDTLGHMSPGMVRSGQEEGRPGDWLAQALRPQSRGSDRTRTREWKCECGLFPQRLVFPSPEPGANPHTQITRSWGIWRLGLAGQLRPAQRLELEAIQQTFGA